MRGGCVLRAQVHAGAISSLGMQILTEDNPWRRKTEGRREEEEAEKMRRRYVCRKGNGSSQEGRGEEGRDVRVMTELQALCLYMRLQAN